MSGTVKVLVTISKEAWKLYKSQAALLSSGGIRSLSGAMLEQFKPIIGFGPVSSAVGIASSLTANVQSVMIQQGVNAANAKLDVVVQQLGSLASAMQGLQQVKVLSWVNSTFSLANCGISVAGFYMTLSRLEKLDNQVGEFFDLYKQDRNDQQVEDYRNYLMQLKGHLSYLQERYKNDTFDRQTFLQRETSIATDLTHTCNYLKKILKAFQDKSIDGKTGCQIIFTLCVVYAQTVNEFCCQYFYAHGIQHAIFNDWLSVLDEIDSPVFREFLKRYFTFDPEYISVSPKLKQAAHHILFESVCQQKNRLLMCADTVKMLPEDQYLHLDDLLNQEVFSGLSNSIPELQGVDVDKVLAQRIEAKEYWTVEDRVMIPMTV